MSDAQHTDSHSAEIVATDLEGTLSSGETWRAMRDYLEKTGRGDRFRRFFRRRLLSVVGFRLKLVDEMAFKERWVLGILALFEGLSAEEMAAMADDIVAQELWPKRRQSVVDELLAHQATGRRVAVVSGMNEPVLNAFVRKLNEAGLYEIEAMGTPLRFDGDAFSGEIVGQLNVGERKVARLKAWMNGGRLVAAYGDTERDIEMLTSAEMPVAVSPDAVLRRTAEAQGWRILEENDDDR